MESNKNYNRRSGLRRYLTNPNEAGYNISWGAILAGVVTFLALFNHLFFNWIGHWFWTSRSDNESSIRWDWDRLTNLDNCVIHSFFSSRLNFK